MKTQSDEGLVASALQDARPSGRGWLRLFCPFCILKTGSPDKRRGLGLHSSTGFYHCFRCGTKGKLRNIPDAMAGIPVEAEEAPPPPIDYPESFDFLSRHSVLNREYRDAFAYLYGRNIGDDLIQAAWIGACTSGKYRKRVVVPITAPGSNLLVGWVSRAWYKESQIPYLYPSGMDRKRILYNHDALFEETDIPVMVVEGVFDVLALWPNAVAVLGKPSEDQIEALCQARRPVSVVLDGDAWQEGWSLGLRLQFEGKLAGSVKLPPRIDPDEIPLDVLYRAAESSIGQDFSVEI